MATYFDFDAYDVERGSDPFVFISYKSEDCDQVKLYARYLHDHGINVWYDNGLHAGSDWESYLMSVIEKPNCKAVLLFVSAKVAQSTVIPLETTQARACKKPTVAIYLEPGLNLETLLNKAIRVYVEQRQSVNAYIGTESSVCAQVLEAAKMAMEGTVTVTHTSVDTLWKNAQMFLMNSRRSRSEEDISRARGYLNQMTEQEPSDYRGWLGLAMCACLHRVENLEGAQKQLGEGAKYYSYVVAAGADNLGSAEYTEVKSRLWQETLEALRRELANCAGLEDVRQLREQAESLGKHFGHTEQYLRGEYERAVAAMEERIQSMETERLAAEKNAEEKAANDAIVSQCEWEINGDGGMTLKKYSGQSSSYEIPAVVDGRSVTRIGKEAFKDCTSLTSVTIPDSVINIGAEAFWCCSGLTSIIIPDSVTSIGVFAFEGCSSFTSITVPRSLTSIGLGVFWLCSSIASITIPDSVTSIGEGAFKYCGNLASITILNKNINIEGDAFEGCDNLTIFGTGGMFSKLKKTAKAMGIKYKKIK